MRIVGSTTDTTAVLCRGREAEGDKINVYFLLTDVQMVLFHAHDTRSLQIFLIW